MNTNEKILLVKIRAIRGQLFFAAPEHLCGENCLLEQAK
jgi:hypothetical protein